MPEREPYVAISTLLSYDRKVRRLDPVGQRIYIELLLICKRVNGGGELSEAHLDPAEICYLVNMPEEEENIAKVVKTIKDIVAAGIAERGEDGSLFFPAWDKWNPPYSKSPEGRLERKRRWEECRKKKLSEQFGTHCQAVTPITPVTDVTLTRTSIGEDRSGQVRTEQKDHSEGSGHSTSSNGSPQQPVLTRPDPFVFPTFDLTRFDAWMKTLTLRYFGLACGVEVVKAPGALAGRIQELNNFSLVPIWERCFEHAAKAAAKKGEKVTEELVGNKLMYVVKAVRDEAVRQGLIVDTSKRTGPVGLGSVLEKLGGKS